MHLLVQAAAEGDVQLLDAAADRQQRQAASDRLADQRQGGRVALRVMLVRGQALRDAVMVRLHVRRAARDQQPIDPIEQRQLRLPHRRDHDRNAPGTRHDSRRIPGRRGVMHPLPHLPRTSRYPHNKTHTQPLN
jgi:glutamine synthetase